MYEPAQSITDQYLADLEDLQDAASEVGSSGGSDDEEMGEDEEFDEFAALKASKLDTGAGVWNTEKFQKHIKVHLCPLLMNKVCFFAADKRENGTATSCR